MSFPIVNHLGRDIALLLFFPNLREENTYRIIYDFPARIEEGESGREDRESLRETINLEQTCYYTLAKAQASQLKQGLAPGALDDKLVGVPLWCDYMPGSQWANDRIHRPGYLVRISDGQIVANGDALEPDDFYAPLIVGHIRQRPDEEAWDEEGGCECEIAVFESSPANYAIAINLEAASIDWPENVTPSWTSVIERSRDGLNYDLVGKGREVSVDGQEKAVQWGQEANFLLTNRDEIRALLGFFESCRGAWKSFTQPVWFKPNPDTGDTPHDSKFRFAGNSIELSFSGSTIAGALMAFWQVPWEINPPEGENAMQDPVAHLFKFTLQTPGTPVVWRFTDWGREEVRIEDGGPVTYLPAPFEYDQITQDSGLEDQPTKLISRVMAGNPVMLILKRMLEANLEVEIWKCAPIDPQAAKFIYVSDVGHTTGTGRSLESETQILSGALDVKVPDFYIQKPCNHDFCDEECGADEEEWTFSGTVVSVAGNAITVDVDAHDHDDDLVDDYFAKGWIMHGNQLTYEARDIIRSEMLGDLQQRFTVKREFKQIAVGETLTFRPSCGGTWTECKEKFSNQINYGGHRHVQADSPSLPSRETAAPGGKK